MEINYKFTEKEKQLLELFAEKGSLSTANDFDGWSGSPEFMELCTNNLIQHYNQDSESDYIRYKLTEIGRRALAQIGT